MSALGERDRLALDLLYAAWAVCEVFGALHTLLEEALEDVSPEALEREDLPTDASREEIGEWLLTGLGGVPC